MKLRLLMVGKTRGAETRALIAEYVNRIGHYTPIEVVEVKDDATAMKRTESEGGRLVVLLDAAGREFASDEMAKWLGTQRDRGTREMIFLCGGAAGYSDELREKAGYRLSLSRLTFSHELARAMLAEQLYRALALLAGHPYPK
jgi:23S rRNA (pseudouridine1915-N3)-methyltransferase